MLSSYLTTPDGVTRCPAAPHVLQTELYRVPLSRCWTPQDWVVHRWRQTLRQDASQDKAVADAPGGAAGAAATAAAQATAAALAAQQHLLSAIGAAFGGGGGAVVDSAAPEVSLGYGTSSRRALTVKEKVDLCNATERERIAFGKVSGWLLAGKVDGWGAFIVSETHLLAIPNGLKVVSLRAVLLLQHVGTPPVFVLGWRLQGLRTMCCPVLQVTVSIWFLGSCSPASMAGGCLLGYP